MGINSTGVAYDFGQLGSAYTDLADKPIIPPQGMVIVAITFIDQSTPSVLTPEKLDERGPGFVGITGTTTDAVGTADDYINFHGFTSAACTGSNSGNNVTISALNTKIQVGQYVLIVNDSDHEGAGLTIDTDTPTPIYSGPNQQGVYVTAYDGATTVTLSTATTPSASQSLIFLGPQQGAGGITAAGQEYPAGLTIYGRWVEFQNSAHGAICYFGK
tara:strand:+ start:130 stop:777 length:648 start_codon:yes stop_codon:yes gene_type:complete